MVVPSLVVNLAARVCYYLGFEDADEDSKLDDSG